MEAHSPISVENIQFHETFDVFQKMLAMSTQPISGISLTADRRCTKEIMERIKECYLDAGWSKVEYELIGKYTTLKLYYHK